MKVELDSFTNKNGIHTTTSPYFIDRLFTEQQQREVRNHRAFRFAADIISRMNNDYAKHLTKHGDTRLRIISEHDQNTLYLGDIAGMPMAKVSVDNDLDGTVFCYQVAAGIKDRGPDVDKIMSKKMGIAIKSLFSSRHGDTPRIITAMRGTRESHVNILYHNVNYAHHRVLNENDCVRPESDVRWTRGLAEFLLDYYERAGDNPPMPTVEVVKQIEEEKARLDSGRKYHARALGIAEEVFGDERWFVIRTEPGFIIGKIKVDPTFLLSHTNPNDNMEITMPFVFVRKFEELAAISTDMHEQFMGAYVMMRAAEPEFVNHSKVYNCSYVPLTDKYFKNTHTLAYFQTSQRFDGGISLSFRALA